MLRNSIMRKKRTAQTEGAGISDRACGNFTKIKLESKRQKKKNKKIPIISLLSN